jgi:PKD repeat protein
MKTLKNVTLLMALFGLITVSSCKKEDTIAEGVSCFVNSPNAVDVGETVSFTNCSQNASSYNWNFGDGSSSNLSSPNHVYTSAGTYEITLTSENVDGLGSSTSKSITVSAKIPVNMIINEITLVAWPASDNGSAWDNTTYPDIYPVINDDNSNNLLTSSIYFEDCSPGNQYVYNSNCGLPITIGSLNNKITISWYDWDLTTSDDWMGGIEFSPISQYVYGENTINITLGEWSYVLSVNWVY